MIKRIQILIKNDDLIQNVETNDGESERDNLEKAGRFQLFMHYPRQLLRTAAIHDEAIMGSNSSLTGTKFTLKQMEVQSLFYSKEIKVEIEGYFEKINF